MRAVADNGQHCVDLRGGCVQIEVQRNIGDQPVGRAIIQAADDRGRGGVGGLHVSHASKLGTGRAKD